MTPKQKQKAWQIVEDCFPGIDPDTGVHLIAKWMETEEAQVGQKIIPGETPFWDIHGLNGVTMTVRLQNVLWTYLLRHKGLGELVTAADILKVDPQDFVNISGAGIKTREELKKLQWIIDDKK